MQHTAQRVVRESQINDLVQQDTGMAVSVALPPPPKDLQPLLRCQCVETPSKKESERTTQQAAARPAIIGYAGPETWLESAGASETSEACARHCP
jgi:hypothetical protein